MGGSRGKPSSVCSSSWSGSGMMIEETRCQICDQSSHTAINCPFIYSSCRLCGSICKVLQSKTSKNPGKLFLKCSNAPKCSDFEWLEDAIQRSMKGYISQHTPHGCFKCGEIGHWSKNCPLQTPLYFSKQTPNRGLAIGGSTLKTEKGDSNTTPTQIIIQTTLGEICEHFKGCNVKD